MTTFHVSHSHPVTTAAGRWPMVVAVAVIGVQAAQILAHSVGRPGFGTDFQLLYTVAAAWGRQADVYDDAVLKATWAAVGDPGLPSPGRPTTPNVYPLTLAPLVWLLTWLPFHAAILVWMVAILLAEGWLIWHALRVAAMDGGMRAPLVPICLAVGVLIFGYPARLNMASLNVAMIAAALAVYGLCGTRSSVLGGIAFGLSLVKYSLTGPLVLIPLLAGRWRVAGVAALTHAILIIAATAGGGYSSPLEWLAGMKAEIHASLVPGGINAVDAVHGAGMHLHLQSLWYRLFGDGPGAVGWTIALAGVLTYSAFALLATMRPPENRGRAMHLVVALVMSSTAVAFYHRAYDLAPVGILTLGWLLGPATGGTGRPWLRSAAWAALLMTVLPGLWQRWDAPDASAWVRFAVQPACAWSALALTLILACRLRTSVGAKAVSC